MADGKSKTGKQDRDRHLGDQDYEVQVSCQGNGRHA